SASAPGAARRGARARARACAHACARGGSAAAAGIIVTGALGDPRRIGLGIEDAAEPQDDGDGKEEEFSHGLPGEMAATGAPSPAPALSRGTEGGSAGERHRVARI